MRGQDDATGVTSPAGGVEGGVIFGQVGVSGVAEDGLYEVKVGNQATGGDEADFHGALVVYARHCGHDDGAQ